MVSFLQYGAKIAKQGGGAQDKKFPRIFQECVSDRASKLRFFKLVILIFFFSNKKKIALFPLKSVSWVERMGRNFNDYPSFPQQHLRKHMQHSECDNSFVKRRV